MSSFMAETLETGKNMKELIILEIPERYTCNMLTIKKICYYPEMVHLSAHLVLTCHWMNVFHCNLKVII